MNSIYALDQPVRLADSSLVLEMVGSVHAGFPSPAIEFAQERFDLFKKLVTHPQATFLMRVRGDSMREVGIFDNSVVVVDRAIPPRDGHIVVAVVDGEYTCKLFCQRHGNVKLKAANPTFADIVPKEGQTLEIWGVVTATVKQFKA